MGKSASGMVRSFDARGLAWVKYASEKMNFAGKDLDQWVEQKRQQTRAFPPGYTGESSDKSLADVAFKHKDYMKAIQLYSLAIERDNNSHILFSNRSLCYSKLQQWDQCKQDANKVLELNPGFAKAYCRLAEAYLGLNDLVACKNAIGKGRRLEDSATLKRLQRELELKLKPRTAAMAEAQVEKVKAAAEQQKKQPVITQRLGSDASVLPLADIERTAEHAVVELLADEEQEGGQKKTK